MVFVVCLLTYCLIDYNDSTPEGIKRVKMASANIINTRGCNGRTALHTAVHFRQKECVVWLLEHRANPNLDESSGLTPLHVASRRMSPSLTALLLDHDANPFKRLASPNQWGVFETPLFSALSVHLSPPVVKVYYERGIWLSKDDFAALVSRISETRSMQTMASEILACVNDILATQLRLVETHARKLSTSISSTTSSDSASAAVPATDGGAQHESKRS